MLTVDLLTDGVDFELAEVAPARVGRKALAVNLSDLAAMAARPVAALVALALPRTGGLELAKRALRRADSAGRAATTWRSPAATRTAGTGRW